MAGSQMAPTDLFRFGICVVRNYCVSVFRLNKVIIYIISMQVQADIMG